MKDNVKNRIGLQENIMNTSVMVNLGRRKGEREGEERNGGNEKERIRERNV